MAGVESSVRARAPSSTRAAHPSRSRVLEHPPRSRGREFKDRLLLEVRDERRRKLTTRCAASMPGARRAAPIPLRRSVGSTPMPARYQCGGSRHGAQPELVDGTARRRGTGTSTLAPMPLPRRFPERDEIAAVRAEADALEAGEEGPEQRRLAGRVLGRREMGKLVFLDLVDRSGRIQLLCPANRTGPSTSTWATSSASPASPRSRVAASLRSSSTGSSCSRASARRCPTRSTG